MHPLLHFGQTKVWDEDGRDAARSFCLLHFSFAALCLSASNSQLMSASCLCLRPPAAMTDGSHLLKLSLQLIFVTLSWSTRIAHSFLELTGEDCYEHTYVFYSCDVASPAQLHLKQDGLFAGQAGSLEDFFVRHVVLPFDAKDGVQAALVKPLK